MAFLAFEGLDGSGKSTLIKGLAQILNNASHKVVCTREPGGTALGDEIRQILLRTHKEAPSPRTELLLYEAGRSQHVDKVLRPAQRRGDWILCDRYYASTLAFQCGGRGLDALAVEQLNQYAIDGCEPDLWVLLDLSVEQSLKRRQGREQDKGLEPDRFERENQAFHQRVRDYYLKLAQARPERWLVLDAMQSPDRLLQKLVEELKQGQWLDASIKL